MTKDEKIQFITSILERESKIDMNTSKEYNFQDEVWLDRYIAKSSFVERYLNIEDSLESAYQAALRLSSL